MKWVEPKVFKIAETSLNPEELAGFLTEIGASDWLEKQPWRKGSPRKDFDAAASLIEVAGRTCYKSFGLGLNPNITRVRQDTRDYIENVARKGDGSVWEHPTTTWAFVDVSRVFCYSADTEVLTDEGWKPWPLVRGDELFASRTPYGELVYVPAEERFVGDYTGPMYNVHSQQVDLLVTPNHRMWAQRVDSQAYRRGEERFALHPASALYHRWVRYEKAGVYWRGERPGLIQIPSTTREWLRRDSQTGRVTVRRYDGISKEAMAFSRFLGYFIAEGSYGHPDTSICLTQNPGAIHADMGTTLVQLGFKPMDLKMRNSRRWKFKSVALYDWLRSHVGQGALSKRIPGIVQRWPSYLIRILLDALIRGDGNVHAKNGHRVLYTSSKALADDVQILALKAGLSANIRVDRRVESHRIFTGQVIRKTAPNYIVSFQVDSRARPHVNLHLTAKWPNKYHDKDGFDDSYVAYSGKVYCVKVPHSLLYVRRNGKPCWSGNTHELVRHRAGTAVSQESLRYVRPKELRMSLVPGSELSKMKNLDELTEAVDATYAAYERFADESLRDDMKFDDKKAWTSALRRMLPDGIATNIVWSANHRALRWVLEMRTAPGAEVEMRYVFDKVGEILQRDYPLLYSDFIKKPHADGVGHQWLPQWRSKV